MRLLLKSFLFFILLVSCGKSVPALPGIDQEKWKADRNACGGYRKNIASVIQTEMNKLKGLSEADIISLLGRPDQNELYERNQKFYSYFLLPAKNCSTPDSTISRLVLRFNAVGYAQSVTIENEFAVQ